MRPSPTRIAVAYAAAAAAWILLSDAIVAALALPATLQAQINVAKGWGFVGVTATILLLLVRREVALIRAHGDRSAESARVAERLATTVRLMLAAEGAIVRSASPRELLEGICSALVGDGRFGLAWVGIPEPDGSVAVAASAGPDVGYLNGLTIRWDGGPLADGPTGTAIRERRTVAVDDTTSDVRVEPWRARLLEAGFGATVAVPIVVDGACRAAISVYSATAARFGPAELAELERVAADTGHALVAFEVAAARDAAVAAAAGAAAEREAVADRYARLVEASPLAIVMTDLDGIVHAWNPASERLWGLPPEAALGRFAPWILDDERSAFLALLADVAAGGRQVGDIRHRHRADGTEVIVRVANARVADADGRHRILFISEDVTAQVVAESALSASRARLEDIHRLDEELRTAATVAEIGAAGARHALRVLGLDSVAVSAYDRTGIWGTVVGLEGRGPSELNVTPGRTLRIADVISAHLASSTEIVTWPNLADAADDVLEAPVLVAAGYTTGAFVPLVDRGRTVGHLMVLSRRPRTFNPEEVDVMLETAGPLAIAVRLADERASAERRQQRLEALHSLDRAILEGETVDAIGEIAVRHLVDLLGLPRIAIVRLDLREGTAALLGMGGTRPTEGAPGRLPLEALVPLASRLATADGAVTIDLDAEAHLGSVLAAAREVGLTRVTALPIRDDRGELIAMLNLGQLDTTPLTTETLEVAESVAAQLAVALRQAILRTELVERERRIRTILEGSPNPILTVGPDLGISYANPAADIAFRAPDGLVGREISELVPETRRDDHRAGVRRWFESPVAGHPTGGRAIDARRLDGTTFPIVIELAPIEGPGGTQAVATIVDLSDRLALERHLAQAQRIDTLGQFSGMLAHDVRSYISAIGWSAEALAADLPPDSPSRTDVALIERAVTEARDMIRSVLEFARPEGQGGATDLVAHIERIGGILSRLLGPDVTIEVELEPGLPPVAIAPASMTQVFFNLATNARTAMAGAGLFRVRAAILQAPPDAELDRPTDAERPRTVRIEISDTGVGMDEETTRRAFDAFFSRQGRVDIDDGVGLGLASVYLLVARAGGDVRIESAPGAGTTFRMDFPEAVIPVT